MKITKKTLTVAMLGMAAAGLAMAQAAPANLDKLKQMKVATTDLNIPLIPQSGPNADEIGRAHV